MKGNPLPTQYRRNSLVASVAILLAAFTATPTWSCDIAVINRSNLVISVLRLYDQNHQYLGRAAQGSIRPGERYIFSQDTTTNGQGTWPDRCQGLVFLEIAGSTNPASAVSSTQRVCRIRAIIGHPSEQALSLTMQNVIEIGSMDINHPGNCKGE